MIMEAYVHGVSTRNVDAARAANTVRDYRADRTDLTTWCLTARPHFPARRPGHPHRLPDRTRRPGL